MSRLVLLAVPSILAQALTLLSQNSNLAYQVPSHGSTKMLASTALVEGKIIQLCIDLFRLYTYIDLCRHLPTGHLYASADDCQAVTV